MQCIGASLVKTSSRGFLKAQKEVRSPLYSKGSQKAQNNILDVSVRNNRLSKAIIDYYRTKTWEKAKAG